MLNLNFTPFPVLYTERLVLRRMNKNDGAAILKLRSDKNVMQYIDRPHMTTEAEALDFIKKIDESLENNYGITWAISLKNNLQLIGTVGFWRIINEHYRAEIGYMLSPDFHGKGIMQEAIEQTLDYGFSIMNLHSVEANVNPGNMASIKLLEKNGFVKEAHFKEHYYHDGKFLDSVIYSLLVQNTLPQKPQT